MIKEQQAFNFWYCSLWSQKFGMCSGTLMTQLTIGWHTNGCAKLSVLMKCFC